MYEMSSGEERGVLSHIKFFMLIIMFLQNNFLRINLQTQIQTWAWHTVPYWFPKMTMIHCSTPLWCTSMCIYTYNYIYTLAFTILSRHFNLISLTINETEYSPINCVLSKLSGEILFLEKKMPQLQVMIIGQIKI